MDRIDVIKSIARNLRDLIIDSVPASACASFVDAADLVQPVSGQLRGNTFYIYSGGGLTQERTVATFTPANNRVGFDYPFTTVPSTNSKFLILDRWDKKEYDNAVDQMVRQAQMRYLEPMVATMTLVATQYEYTVPSGMKFIHSIVMVPSGDSDYPNDEEVNTQVVFPPRYWSVGANPLGSYLIMFKSGMVDMDNYDNERTRVMGQAQPSVGTTDASVVPSDLEQYIIDGASMLLSSQMVDEDSRWKTRFYLYRDNTRANEEFIFRHRRGKPVG